ncbi:MAG: integrase core domain-containing protein [Spirochaetaceae bacterium]|nr:integrase core domain-containing protein [Spirochaetaceae bacterium]
MCKAEEYLASIGVPPFWTRPYAPKEKPFVERFIGTLQRECLDYNYAPMNVTELRKVADGWLHKYHFHRPHASSGLSTPAEFSAKLGVPIPSNGVSYR